jgi:hypothetical protein
MHKRGTQGTIIAISIVVIIVLVLLAANINPVDRPCAWQFPLIASCLLSSRETLVSGLVAAGGALFAAWAAWTAVREQIEFEMNRDAAAKSQLELALKKTAKGELAGLLLTQEHIEKIITTFRDLGAASDWSYVENLRVLNKSGELSFYSQPLPAPFAGISGYLTQKMNQLAARIEQVEGDKNLRNVTSPMAMTPELRKALIDLDRSIKETVDEYLALRGGIQTAITERDAIIRA